VRRLAEGQREPHGVISGTDLERLIAILAKDLRSPVPAPHEGTEDDEE
jgi:hypothetical protein